MSQHKDPVTALDFLIANIKTIINKAKVTKKTKKNKLRKNWITVGIIKYCQKKDCIKNG